MDTSDFKACRAAGVLNGTFTVRMSTRTYLNRTTTAALHQITDVSRLNACSNE